MTSIIQFLEWVLRTFFPLHFYGDFLLEIIFQCLPNFYHRMNILTWEIWNVETDVHLNSLHLSSTGGFVEVFAHYYIERARCKLAWKPSFGSSPSIFCHKKGVMTLVI